MAVVNPSPAVPAPPGGGWGWLTRWTTMVVLFLVWEWAARIWLPKSQPDLVTLMPAPSAVLAAGQELLASGDLLHHLWASLKRELTAFSFALVALPLGIAMGWWPRVNRQLDPVIEILRPIPPIAWIPLSLLWLGIGVLPFMLVTAFWANFQLTSANYIEHYGLERRLVATGDG